jgi:hypothetical protein
MATDLPIKYCGNIHASEAKANERASGVIAILLHGSWNDVGITRHEPDDVPRWVRLVRDALREAGSSPPNMAYACVRADADDESLDICINEISRGGFGAPSELPAVMFLAFPTAVPDGDGDGDGQRGWRVEHVVYKSAALVSLLLSTGPSSHPPSRGPSFASSVLDAWSRLADGQNGNVTPPTSRGGGNVDGGIEGDGVVPEPAIRLFVAGDRSRVGKSSICMGLLGSLLDSGRYRPSDLAYIKPATQCEQAQLVEEFCKHRGISACVPVGPIVYYRGFTRAFLRGETDETSARLLEKARDAVDEVASNRRVVIIDGVGYPAVGSITGTDNASVAKICGRSFHPEGSATAAVRSPAPVLLVGKSGVGDAVDSFNINATYFAHRDVPVIGAVFNRLSLDGYYSLSNCKDAVELYFGQSQPDRIAFGFIPEMPSLANAREQVADSTKADQLSRALETADAFVEEFSKHVNVDMILNAAKKSTAKYISEYSLNNSSAGSNMKRSSEGMESVSDSTRQYKRIQPATATEFNRNNTRKYALTREQVESLALVAGAAGG